MANAEMPRAMRTAAPKSAATMAFRLIRSSSCRGKHKSRKGNYAQTARPDSTGNGDAVQMRLDHLLDPGRARAAGEPIDGALVLDHDKRGDVLDAEPLGEVGPLVGVDAKHPHTVALLAGDVREQALHAPCRP